MRDLTTHSQSLLQKGRSQTFETEEIAVPVVDDVYEEPAFGMGGMLEIVCSLDEPILQMSLLARVVEVTQKDF